MADNFFKAFNPWHKASLPKKSLKAYNLTVKHRKKKSEIAWATFFNFTSIPLISACERKTISVV